MVVVKRLLHTKVHCLLLPIKGFKFLSSIINKFLPIKWSHYEEIMVKKADALRHKKMQKIETF